jgi:hypothetical protein
VNRGIFPLLRPSPSPAGEIAVPLLRSHASLWTKPANGLRRSITIPPRRIDTTTGRDSAKERFFAALAGDLRRLGADVELQATAEALRLKAVLPATPARVDPGRVRAEQVNRRLALVERARRDLLDRWFAPALFDVQSVLPQVKVCRGRADDDLFSYCKLTQSVPSAPRVGRRIRLLVTDGGQRQERLIGAIELASPIYTLASRDRHLGWARAGRDGKTSGLRRVMDLATCVAAPAYAPLRAGKLLAAIACSSVACEEFERRYGDSLLAVVATCATGLHYPHVNRVVVRSRRLYERIGETAGYSTALFSQETVAAARDLLTGGEPAGGLDDGYEKLLRLMRAALRACGIPEDAVLRAGIPKGVYLGATSDDAVDALRLGGAARGTPVTFEEVAAWWADVVLSKAARRPDLVQSARQAGHRRPLPSALLAG